MTLWVEMSGTVRGNPPSFLANRQRARYAPPADAALALADGRVFRGRGFGAAVDAQGEVVFTTTMVGYQEVTTDPSFRGQIVCMTYPLIGNYGIHDNANESRQPWVAGLVVREFSETPSHAGSTGTIHEFLERHGIPGIAGIDTRSLTLHIRDVGDTRGVIIQNALELTTRILSLAPERHPSGECDVVGEVTASEPETIEGAGPAHRRPRLRCKAKHCAIARQAGMSGDRRSLWHHA